MARCAVLGLIMNDGHMEHGRMYRVYLLPHTSRHPCSLASEFRHSSLRHHKLPFRNDPLIIP
jgi:hypothetical protein